MFVVYHVPSMVEEQRVASEEAARTLVWALLQSHPAGNYTYGTAEHYDAPAPLESPQ